MNKRLTYKRSPPWRCFPDMLLIWLWVSRALVISHKMLHRYNFYGFRAFWQSNCRVSAHLCGSWRLHICVFAWRAISCECNYKRRSAFSFGKSGVRKKSLVFIQIKLDALDLGVLIILCLRPCSKRLMRRLAGYYSEVLASFGRWLSRSTLLSQFSTNVQGASWGRFSW